MSKIKGHQEHAGFGLLRDPLLLGSGMRSVSSFSLVDVPNDDSESDRKGEVLERRTGRVRGEREPPRYHHPLLQQR